LDTAQLLDVFRGLTAEHKICVQIDPVEYTIKSPCAIDVEHDEQGNMVCIGTYDGENFYCFTKVTPELKRQLEQ